MSQPTAMITGAGSGLGRALAVQLAERGNRVHLVGRRRERLDETADLVRQAGGEPLVHECDVSSDEQVAALAAAVGEPLDLLVLNAGVTTTGPLLEQTLDDWRWVYGTVLGGVVLGIHHFVPAMVAADRGQVVIVGSQAGLVPDGFVQHGPYTSAKTAVISLAMSLTEELRESGVQVSLVIPSGISTGFARASQEGRVGAEEAEPRAPIRPRPGLPAMLPGHADFLDADEVARVALTGIDRGDAIIATHPGARPMLEEYFGRILRAYDAGES